ncbi:MAG: hypothetical protein IMF11_12670 [Proteobacteria bacterium]|nr:hypothetical protein [Pseudomonadota bacterium]
MKINLHIDRLVLDGISVESHQQAMFKANLETELGRLLAQNGIAPDLQSGGAFNAIRTDSIDVGEKNEPSHLGRQIARSVYGGIN